MNYLAKATHLPSNSGKLKKLITQHSLFFFFLMAYLFSWITLVPYILSQWNILPSIKIYQLFVALSTFTGPALSALVVSSITRGKAAQSDFKNSFKMFKVGKQWYAFILLVIPALLLLGIVILPGAISSVHGLSLSFFIGYPINFLVIFFIGGPLGEEIGWRGFALPRMQSRYGAVKATLLLGVLWTFWHLPLFFTSSQGGGPGTGLSIFYINFPIFFMMVMALAIIFTWVYNHTKGSLFIAVLLHASIDTFSIVVSLFSAPIVTKTDLPILIGSAIPALLILILTHGKLGYKSDNKRITEE